MMSTSQKYPIPNEKINYYQEALKLYYFNCILYYQFEKLLSERNQILEKLNSYDLKNNESEGNLDNKKKPRRCASEIDRTYTCQYQGCLKSYGSEGSLVQHMRLKHDGQVRTNTVRLQQTSAKEMIEKQMQKIELQY